MSDYHHNHELILCGFAIFLAIVLHKPLDALSITTLMTAGGWSPRSRLLVNLGFAIMCPLGAAMVILGAEQFSFLKPILPILKKHWLMLLRPASGDQSSL